MDLDKRWIVTADDASGTGPWQDFLIPVDDIWLSITDRCNLDCSYCCMTKGDHVLSLAECKKAVDLLFRKGSNPKHITFSGGEPMLCFDLIRQVVGYAKEAAKKTATQIRFTVLSNGTIMDAQAQDFLKKSKVNLFFTISGREDSHDRFRINKSGDGSHSQIVHNVRRCLESGVHLCANLIVHPEFSGSLWEDFRYLCTQGLRRFALCAVNGVPWNEESLRALKENYLKILEFIFDSINERDFIYLESINRIIYQDILASSPSYDCSGGNTCPLQFRITVFPNGRLGMNLFSINDMNIPDYYIGSVSKGLHDRFNGCSFDPKSRKCQECMSYLRDRDKTHECNLSGKELETRYMNLSKLATRLLCDSGINTRFAGNIVRRSKEEHDFADYIGSGEGLFYSA